jgi:DNA (cytosine-5)-methyltransferase 1
MNNTKTVMSLFSGCGGIDLGFEGDFKIPSCSFNQLMHPEWCGKLDSEKWIKLKKNDFKIVFANDIDDAAKRAWVREHSRFSKKG